MARPPRLSLPSYPHHVIQRGNNRQPICFEEKERARVYSDRLGTSVSGHELDQIRKATQQGCWEG